MNKISLILTATLLLLQACGDNGESRAMGTLERDRIQLSAPVAEQIADIHVVEGDKVEAGQLLLQLDSRSAAARVAQRRAELAEAGARLDELQQGARVEERRAARAAIEAATAAATEARLRYQRTRELFAAKVVGQAELDAAIAERDHTKPWSSRPMTLAATGKRYPQRTTGPGRSQSRSRSGGAQGRGESLGRPQSQGAAGIRGGHIALEERRSSGSGHSTCRAFGTG